MDMKKRLLVVFLFLLPLTTLKAGEQKSLELPRIQVVPIQDPNTGREYELLIKLPGGYDKSGDKKHPVIYFTDAMWHVEILSATVEYVIEDAILVGITWQKNLAAAKHEWSSRGRDLVPALGKDSKGEAHKYLTFLRSEVIKYIESSYRANPDNRTYFGYSVGGLFGAYTLLSQPDTFKNYIIGSPWFGPYLTSLFEPGSHKVSKDLLKQTNVFISHGALEEKLSDKVAIFVSQLKSRKIANLSLESAVIESADHTTAFPKTSVRSIYWLADRLKP
ncbi:alpha/beta hydrolase [Exilibacterium tricleocarpae]|uniref:Alpha/beta hydrolase n=1 Tax=Exilibacterium tricleocarpae TaxID=2591008 RepID=A0A545TM32_9GAMM|nr:alpha/beta hydrolase [Exilibacterium tricleocarpae]